MSGITSTLSIAKTAITAQQYALNVTGHNIANVNNPDYSIQDAQLTAAMPASYAGYMFGTGVDMSQVQQSVDQLLENRLTTEISSQAAMVEAESYMQVLEGIFDENSSASLSSMITDYWNAWHDLSNNPLGTSERIQIHEKGELLTRQFNTILSDLDRVEQDLTQEIDTALSQVNSLSLQIAELNGQILGLESSQTANDLRDQRNGLIDELGALINIDVITQGDGSYIINAANGATLVNGVDANSLALSGGQVMWQGTAGWSQDITDDISGGKLSGWLDIRDEVVPTYQGRVNELASEMIWAVNYQHSQGAGLSYIFGPTEGTYQSDESGWLSSLPDGDRIDYSKDFSMWVEDTSSAESEFRQILMDMGISQASLSNWQGAAPGGESVSYRLTVVDEGVIGDKITAQASGTFLDEIQGTTSGGAVTALDQVMAAQTLTLNGGPEGTRTIDISDSGGDAQRSAASIAEALSRIEGVEAYAASTQVELGLGQVAAAQDGDMVRYSIYVDGSVYDRSFVADSSAGTLEEQFEDSLVEAAHTVNNLNDDTDLYADGLLLTSDKGATLGIQDFEVVDNAGIRLDSFTGFNTDDIVSLTLATDGVPTTSTRVDIDLSAVSDVTDQAQMAAAFYDALSGSLPSGVFSVELDETTDSVVLRTMDGANITLSSGTGDTGDDAAVSLSALTGTATSGIGNTSFEFTAGGTDVEVFNSQTLSADILEVSIPGSGSTAAAGTTASLMESTSTAGTGVTAAVTAGSLTVYLDPDMELTSDTWTDQGLFGTSGTATTGSSILTLGGIGGYEGFDAGDTISFEVDGQAVSLTLATSAGATTDAAIAQQLYAELNTDITSQDYQFILNGTSVSILKHSGPEKPLEITGFTDSSNDAVLSLSTGTGIGSEDPENNRLASGNVLRNFSAAAVYGDEAVIQWEKFNPDGTRTGENGLITVAEAGTVSIVEDGAQTLSFEINSGALVAGNTLTINTDGSGEPDPLEFEVFRQANSINDIYQFEVVQGGTVGHMGEDEDDVLTIRWSSSISSGTFEIEGHDPPRTPDTPVQAEVDGLLINFYDGTLADGEVFTINTDESGFPVPGSGDTEGERMSDWHWTLDSFADEFNRNGSGMTASVTLDNRLVFESDDSYCRLENLSWSGENGFDSVNGTVTVLDHSVLEFKALDMQFVRSNGSWGIVNDATGGVAQIIPQGGDDNGFRVDLDGDGLGDLEIDFASPVSGDGAVRFDLTLTDPSDIGYAFGGLADGDCGLLAAAGVNTFFTGSHAMDMAVNQVVSDTGRIGAGIIDPDTGLVTTGSNLNAIAMTEVQYETRTLVNRTFERGQAASSSITQASLDDYYNALIGSLGVTSRSVTTSREFADIMVAQITEQRDAVSAVSLDEEMIKLMKYQHAYTAASKLLTVADEMLQTLLSTR